MRKPAFCIWENKGADQLRGYGAADLISTFVYATSIVQSLFFLNLAIVCCCRAWFLFDLVRNPEDRFSHDTAQNELCCEKSCFLNIGKRRALISCCTSVSAGQRLYCLLPSWYNQSSF